MSGTGSTPTNGSTTNTEPDPELFNHGQCDVQMPAKEITESFDFGQFVDLVIVPDPLASPTEHVDVILHRMSDSLLNSKLIKMVSENTNNSTLRLVDALEGIPIMDLVKDNVKELLKPVVVKDVPICDMGDFLAKRKFEHNSKPIDVDLNNDQITDLLGGNSVVVTPPAITDGTIVRLVPPKINVDNYSTEPAITMHTIWDLPTFLNEPLIPGLNGKPYKIELSPRTINDLLINGVAHTLGENNIKLVVGKAIDE